MKYIQPLHDIVIETVRARGVPNQECIVLRTLSVVDSGSLALLIGYRDSVGNVQALRNYMFWFGDNLMAPGTLINIYTGSGEANAWPTGNGSYVHNVFWGLENTIFTIPEFLPVLTRIQQATVGETPQSGYAPTLPQLPSSSNIVRRPVPMPTLPGKK